RLPPLGDLRLRVAEEQGNPGVGQDRHRLSARSYHRSAEIAIYRIASEAQFSVEAPLEHGGGCGLQVLNLWAGQEDEWVVDLQPVAITKHERDSVARGAHHCDSPRRIDTQQAHRMHATRVVDQSETWAVDHQARCGEEITLGIDQERRRKAVLVDDRHYPLQRSIQLVRQQNCGRRGCAAWSGCRCRAWLGAELLDG